MTLKHIILLGAVLLAGACEQRKGVGFTGIGQPTTSQSTGSAYALDFEGL